MSGVDPLAALAAQLVANAQNAIAETELNLGTLLADFKAQINVGDVLTATVLPPENGSDRISLLGQTVTAQLPPGIHPGETLALQVTGFTNTAILVRNLNGEAPQTPPDAPQTAILSRTPQQAVQQQAQQAVQQQPPQPQQSQTQPAQTQQPQPQQPPVAPPRELFVAASVKQTNNIPPQIIVTRADEAPAAPGNVEARIIASRTSPVEPPHAQTPAEAAAPKTPQSPPAPQTPQHVLEHVPLTTLLKKTLVPPVLVKQALLAREKDVPTGPVDAQQVRAAATPEGAFLARLRVPLSGTTLAAVRLIDRAAQSVTSTYQKLDAILAKLAPEERVSTLRAMLTFVNKIDMRNVRAMPEQIASFVSNVVSGPETKIAQLVRAWTAQIAMQEAPAASPQQPSQAANASAGELPAAPAAVAPEAEPAALAHAAERAVALDHDVKASILQLIANPPSDASPQVVQALREALTATTAMQLNTLNGQQQNPNAITIALPAYFHEDGRPTQLRISKDASGGKNALDANNFHVAFVLDTASLGTVAIDLQTVGRHVSLDVKTEGSRSANQFRSTLPQLSERLEKLHYRVDSMKAGVVERLTQPAPTQQTDPAVQAEKPQTNLDTTA